MKRLLFFLAIAVSSIFLGSQLTEGFLLLPYWKDLPADEFYAYYTAFGPRIGRFYTFLTIIAAVIPASLSIYCFFAKNHGLRYSLASTFFAFLVIALFYFYFKGANEQFYEARLTSEMLQEVLETWGRWHWARVFVEVLALVFLCLALDILVRKEVKNELN